MTLWLQIIIVFLLIVANGFCAMLEIALVSSRKARLKVLERQGYKSAAEAIHLVEQPSRVLSTVQIVMTLINIVAGVYSGATIAEELRIMLEGSGLFGSYATAVSYGVVVAVITLVTLIIGELVPKQIGLHYAERLMAQSAKPLNFLAIAAYPAVKLLSWSSTGILRLMKLKHEHSHDVSEEEVKVMVEHGEQTGVFEREEREMLEGALGLADKRISELMTPRPEIDWIDSSATTVQISEIVGQSTHKRFPVCEGDLDRTIGIVHAKDVLSLLHSGSPVSFKDCLRETLYLTENASALEALRQFKLSRTHFAMVVNEYGAVRGMITINDVVEEVLGTIPTSADIEEENIVQRDDGSWLIDGMIDIEEFKKQFTIDELPNEKKLRFRTLAGFIIGHRGEIPKVAYSFEWNGLRFEIVDMDGQRIDKVLISIAPNDES